MYALRLHWAAVIGVSLLVLIGCGGSPQRPLAINGGTEVLVADVDADGRRDVVALTYQFGDQPHQGLLTVRRQTQAGHFAPAESYVVGCYPWSMALTDVDGDGHADLVVTDVSYTGCADPAARPAIYILRQDPAQPGHFLAPVKVVEDIHTYRPAIVDLNGDGAPDISYGESLTGSVRYFVVYQDPLQRGRFAAPVAIAAPGAVADMVAGDIDGDGRGDLLMMVYEASSSYPSRSMLAVVVQRADGTLAPPVPLSNQTGVNVERLGILDVDGDGRNDLLAFFTPASTDYHRFLRTLRQGSVPLTWSAPVDVDVQFIPGTCEAGFGDLDQDGRPDVVLGCTWPESGGPLVAPDVRGRVNLLLGRNGGGTFVFAAGIDVSPWPDAVAIGDLDGDGRDDIVLHDGNAQWWMRQTATAGSFATPQPLP
jgi:hypothetical protein